MPLRGKWSFRRWRQRRDERSWLRYPGNVIPPEVRARAERLGLRRAPDWYAGRRKDTR